MSSTHPALADRALLPDLGRRTLVMGILNVTPDSFSDGGLFAPLEAAVAHAEAMAREGADIIDVGGESTRPGHVAVDAADEIERVVPIIAALSPRIGVPISIDTYKAATAAAALRAGAAIVNDVWGLQREPEIARIAAEFGAPVVAMHNRDTIDAGLDIVDDMKRFFAHSIAIARQAGIADRDIILDPGIGFGKSPAQNLEALRRLGELTVLGHPILVGTSRKSFIGRILDKPPSERVNGTIASNVAAIIAGAAIIRVHDVAPHVEAARVTDAILGKNP
ncbi:MAG: dihydropteroate synthase [Ancalomicrobiaceae bacterium]|nr:dihydropteroate synthase [Ancalomicrobiaceae bacterium]